MAVLINVPSEKFNDDSAALNDVHIWAVMGIRGNGWPHSANNAVDQPIVDSDRHTEVGGDCSNGFIGPARRFEPLTLQPLQALPRKASAKTWGRDYEPSWRHCGVRCCRL